MKKFDHDERTLRPERHASPGGRAMWALMGLMVVALVAAILMGAPLVSVLLVGLLLLCPLLMWMPSHSRPTGRTVDKAGRRA